MNYRLVCRIVGSILLIEAIFMIPALLIAFILGETAPAFGFCFTIALLGCIGGLLHIPRPRSRNVYAREGFITVSFSWIIISLLGALPFTLSGEIPSYIDALFETVSGFSTTGASILPNVELLSKSLLYWRSFTHWLGGMGVLVFVLAVIPRGNEESGGSMHILRAESPGPAVGKLVPRMRDTARILYLIYIIITLVQVVLLILGGMPIFDSVLTSFGTAGTGGFGIKADSLGGYNSYIQMVTAVFMLLCGINFNIYYLFLIKEWKQALKNEELRLYLGVIAFAVITIALNIYPEIENIGIALRDSFFTVASMITTTGFSTADFNLWPVFSKCMLVIIMFIGACAGSTGGGIKVSRILILLKSIKNELQKLLHPRSVKAVKMDGKLLDSTVTHNVFVYISVYILIMGGSILLISLDNFSFTTTVTSVISCFNNIGPGLDMVGPSGNFSEFSVFSKLVLCANMLLGRLELFPMLLMFSPSLWKRGK